MNMDSRSLPQNKTSFGSNQLSKFRHFTQKSVPTIWPLSLWIEGTTIIRRPKGIDWQPRTVVWVAREGTSPLLSRVPHTCGQLPLLTTTQQLRSYLTTNRCPLARLCQRVHLNSSSPPLIASKPRAHDLERETRERERDREDDTGWRERKGKGRDEGEGRATKVPSLELGWRLLWVVVGRGMTQEGRRGRWRSRETSLTGPRAYWYMVAFSFSFCFWCGFPILPLIKHGKALFCSSFY